MATSTSLEGFVRQTMDEWQLNHVHDLRFITAVDVGATNTRVALRFWRSSDSGLGAVQQSSTFEFGTLEIKSKDKLLSSLDTISRQVLSVMEGRSAEAAAIAIAGPVDISGSFVSITNFDQTPTLFKSELPLGLFPPGDKTRMLNDLQAACNGILATGLSSTDPNSQGLAEYFSPLWDISEGDKSKQADGIELKKAHYLVLAMGTGLGVGLIVSLSRGSTERPEFEVLPLEGGHCLAPPLGLANRDASKDREFYEFMSRYVYSAQHVIEYEDVCSGRGLRACYKFVAQQISDAPAIEKESIIAARAMEQPPDLYCAEALYLHYKYLMKAAQNFSILTQCKAVFLAGDNQVKNDDFVRSKAQQLREEFLCCPKREWLKNVACHRQTKSMNFNLAGAFFVAQQNV